MGTRVVLDTNIIVSGLGWRGPVVETDPTDNRVLECALAGNAEVIVTGDDHLLDLEEFEKILILRPRAFLERFKHP